MDFQSISKLFLVDPLSVFFLIAIAIVSIPSAIYSIGYLKKDYPSSKILLAWVLMIIFVISMCLVVTAKNIIFFLVIWEIMSLVSYFLVVFDSTHEKSIQAGTIYIIMTHIGTAFLIAAFMILYKYTGSFDLLSIKSGCMLMPQNIRNAVFLLLVVGFGTKAGIVPLHIWLPYAHPQAPSHISSIMSGVMIKTAIYGLIRFVIFILGVGASWWGILIIILATFTCLVGVIYALMEKDIKRLLAYSSVENIGIILLGVGLAIFFMSINMPYLAIFSLIAGLYHLVNHAIFKGLLFLGSGSIYQATGTRDMEKLGGLIKRMPQTAIYFLVGVMAISALPPLNGFVSEWLTLQAFFLGALNTLGGTKLFLCIVASLLCLTGGLAIATFIKAFGIIFLAQPRSRNAKDAKEVSISMRISMAILSVLVILLGLAAGFIIKMLSKIAGFSAGVDISNMSFTPNNFIISLQANPQVSGADIYLSLPILAIVLVATGLLGVMLYMFKRKKAVIYKTWDCGYYKLDPRNEYTATAFSKPFRIAFSFFLLPYRKTQKIRESFYYVKSFRYETHTTKVFKEYIYEPMLSLIFKLAKYARRIQPGSIHLYLAYIFMTLILLIVFMGRF